MREATGSAILLLATIACAPGPALPALDRAAIKVEIVAARDRVWRAWFAGDSAGLVAALPDSMVAMGETSADIIANALAFRAAGNRLVHLSFSDSEFMLTDTMAVVVSTFRVETVRNDSTSVMGGRAIEVFVREGSFWVNPYWHLDQEAPDGE
jgi:hypothetical protein